MSKQPTSNFRDLRATFEQRSKPTTATAYRSVAGDLANMASQQQTKRVPSLAKSIDSVLDTPPATSPVRPMAKLRPSWIGPIPVERPVTPGVEAMKQAVTIMYSAPGLQPPVFVCSSLSEPQWEAIEMYYEVNEHGVNVFFMVFHVVEGEYEYKFRLGLGDWWVCDESKPMIEDGQGNKNNLLVLKSESPLGAVQSSRMEQTGSKATSSNAPEVGQFSKSTLQTASIVTPAHYELEEGEIYEGHPAALLKHETFQSSKGAASEQTAEKEQDDPMELEEGEIYEAHPAALLEHETFKPTGSAYADDDSGSCSMDISSESEDEDEETVNPPLFRHETMKPSTEAHEPPVIDATPVKHVSKPMPSSPIPEEAGPHHMGLERFPTHQAGIIEKIMDTRQRLPEDEYSHDGGVGGSPLSKTMSGGSVSSRTLSSVHETDEEVLEKIREAEEEEFEKEVCEGEEVDPLTMNAPLTPPVTSPEPEDADFLPKVIILDKKVQVEEHIIIEVIEERKSFMEALLDKIGGQGNAIAMAVGLLVIAAGICTMQFL